MSNFLNNRKQQVQEKKITSVGKDVEKWEPSYIVGGNVKWCSHCGKLVVPQKAKQ